MLLRITEGPIAEEAPKASTAVGGADATEKDTTAQQTLLVVLGVVGVNALAALVVVLLGTVLIAVVVRSRRKFHQLEPDAKAAIVENFKEQQGTQMQSMGGDSSFASDVSGVAAMGLAPRVPPNKPPRALQKPALKKKKKKEKKMNSAPSWASAPKKPARPTEKDSSSTKTKKKKKRGEPDRVRFARQSGI